MLVERSVVIHKPVAEVFAFVHDHKNFLAWQKEVISSQEEKGPANTIGSQ
jgi:Polyketide cyclase / dehydrase and lipid transport.